MKRPLLLALVIFGFAAFICSKYLLLILNSPGIGNAILVCGTNDQTRTRTCGNNELGMVLEEIKGADGALIRRWYPGGTEYFREVEIRGEPTRLFQRAVLPCWQGQTQLAARGSPLGMESNECVDGVGASVK